MIEMQRYAQFTDHAFVVVMRKINALSIIALPACNGIMRTIYAVPTLKLTSSAVPFEITEFPPASINVVNSESKAEARRYVIVTVGYAAHVHDREADR